MKGKTALKKAFLSVVAVSMTMGTYGAPAMMPVFAEEAQVTASDKQIENLAVKPGLYHNVVTFDLPADAPADAVYTVYRGERAGVLSAVSGATVTTAEGKGTYTDSVSLDKIYYYQIKTTVDGVEYASDVVRNKTATGADSLSESLVYADLSKETFDGSGIVELPDEAIDKIQNLSKGTIITRFTPDPDANHNMMLFMIKKSDNNGNIPGSYWTRLQYSNDKFKPMLTISYAKDASTNKEGINTTINYEITDSETSVYALGVDVNGAYRPNINGLVDSEGQKWSKNSFLNYVEGLDQFHIGGWKNTSLQNYTADNFVGHMDWIVVTDEALTHAQYIEVTTPANTAVTEVDYGLTLDLDGGELAETVSAKSESRAKVLTLPEDAPVKAGNEFKGWKLGDDEVLYQPGDEVVLYQDNPVKTLTAQYEKAEVALKAAATAVAIKGEAAILPTQAAVTAEDGTTTNVDVTWNAADTSAAGTVTVTGTAQYNDQSIEAVCTLQVLDGINLSRLAGVTFSKNDASTDNVNNLKDGLIINYGHGSNNFTTWNNPDATLEVTADFDYAKKISSVNLYFCDYSILKQPDLSRVKLEVSQNGTDWTEAAFTGNYLSYVQTDGYNVQPCHLDLNEEQSARYMRITIDGDSTGTNAVGLMEVQAIGEELPYQSREAAISSLKVNGRTVNLDFLANGAVVHQDGYKTNASKVDVEAAAVSNGTVTVSDPENNVQTVTVTSEDGSATAEYKILLNQEDNTEGNRDIPNDAFTLYSDYAHRTDEGPIEYALDNSLSTWMHSRYDGENQPNQAAGEQYFEFTLKEPALVDGFRYLRRNPANNGVLSKLKIEYQAPGDTEWKLAPVSGNVDENGILTWSVPAEGGVWNRADFSESVLASKVKVTAIEASGGFLSAAEVRLSAGKTDISAGTAAVAADAVWNEVPGSDQVTVTVGGKTLVEGRDFTIADALEETDGKNCAVINGVGEYKGTLKAQMPAEPVAETFTVSFVDEEGNKLADDQTVEKGKTAAKPADPEKTGYTFDGWFAGDAAYDFESEVNAALTLTGKFTIKTYSVVFKDGDSTVKEATVNHGSNVEAPVVDEREGYEFKGWTDGEGNTVDLTQPVTGDLTLSAVWEKKEEEKQLASLYISDLEWTSESHGNDKENKTEKDLSTGKNAITLFNGTENQTFDKGIGTHADSTITYDIQPNYKKFEAWVGVDAETASKPTEALICFTVEVDGKEVFNSGDMQYQTDSGEKVPMKKVSVDVSGGQVLTLKIKAGHNGWSAHGDWADAKFLVEQEDADLTKLDKALEDAGKLNGANYTADSWNNLVEKVEAGNTAKNKADITTTEADAAADAINAAIEALVREWTVTFKNEDDSVIKTVKVANSDKATAPDTEPSKEGHTFKGWVNAEDNTTFSLNTAIEKDVTLKPVFEINKYTVTFTGEGVAESTAEVAYNEKVTKPADPTREGFIFNGWKTAEGNDYNFEAPVTGELTLTASWTEVPSDKNIFRVVYHVNGGTMEGAADDQMTVTEESEDESYSFTLTDKAPTKAHWTFEGWADAADATVPNVTGDIVVAKNETKHVYAVYNRVIAPEKTQAELLMNLPTSSQGNMLDKNPDTFTESDWHSDGQAFLGASKDNRAITIILTNAEVVDSFRYLPRDPENKGDRGNGGAKNGFIKEYEVYGQAPGSEEWVLLGTGTWYIDETGWKDAEFAPFLAQKVRLNAVHTFSANPAEADKLLSAAEVRLRMADEQTIDTLEVPSVIKVDSAEASTELSASQISVKSGDKAVGAYNYDIAYEKAGDTVTVTATGKGAANGSAAATYKVVNTAPVTEAVAATADLVADNYTEASWTALQNAITAANDVKAKDAPTQQEIDDAAKAVTDAKDALVNVHTVIFNLDDGTEHHKAKVPHNEFVTLPAAPEKEGHTFAGWMLGTELFDEKTTAITGPITLTASFTKNEEPVVNYTVTFMDGETKVSDETVAAGGKVTKPADPTKSGFTFNGWYNGETEYDFDSPVTANLTLSAKWTEDTPATTVNKKALQDLVDSITTENLVAANYTDASWKDFDTAFTAAKTVLENPDATQDDVTAMVFLLNMNHEALVRAYTVTFKADGNEIKTEKVETGKAATAPANPSKEGYTFKGWDKEFNNVTENMEVNAVFEQNTPSVTVNKKALQDLVDSITAENLSEDSYTDQSWDTFDNVLDSAKTILGKEDGVTQGDVDLMVTLLNSAKNALVRAHAVTFKNDDQTVATVKVEDGKTVTLPEAPEKDGYTFNGWMLDGQPFDEKTAITNPITLTAAFTKNEDPVVNYTVTFMDGDTKVSEATVAANDTVTRPEDPAKAGYTFTGWKTADGADYNFSAPVTGNLTLTASWAKDEEPVVNYTVTFMDGEDKVSEATVAANGIVTKPEDPVKAGYTFNGWKTADGADYNFETPVTGNLTLTASWTKDEEPVVNYTVTFMDGEDKVSEATVAANGTVDKPADPVKAGYTFTGWKTADGADFNFSTPVTGNLTLTASWTKDQEPAVEYTVTFMDGDNKVSEATVAANGTVTKPADPEKEGYTFNGWMLDGKAYDFSTPVTGNMTLTASWTKDEEPAAEYTVTFMDGDNKVSEVTVAENETVTKPADPEKEGYTFNGWMLDGKAYDFSSPVTGNITLTASWTKNEEPSVEPADKSKLESAYDQAAKYADKFSGAQQNALKDALADAKDVLDNEDATQEEVDAALKALNAVPYVEADKLVTAVVSAEKATADKYTTANWKELQAAIKEAKEILANRDASAEEINASIARVDKAVKNTKSASSATDKPSTSTGDKKPAASTNGKKPANTGVGMAGWSVLGTAAAALAALLKRRNRKN